MRTGAACLVSLVLSAVQGARVGQLPEYRELDPNEKLSLEVSCPRLLGTPVDAKHVFLHLDISEEANWLELTTDPQCFPLFFENCFVLHPIHVAQLFRKRWEWEDAIAPSVQERLEKFREQGCLRDIQAWDGVTMNDLDEAEKMDLRTLTHWTNFKPEVLAHLLLKQGYLTDLPAPLSDNRLYIRNLLEAATFLDAANNDLWSIFNHDFVRIACMNAQSLGASYANMLASVSSRLSTDGKLALLATRLQLFIKLSIENKDRYRPEELLKLAQGPLRQTVKNIRKASSNQVVRRMASSWSPEVKAVYENICKEKERESMEALLLAIFEVPSLDHLGLEGELQSSPSPASSPISLAAFSRLLQADKLAVDCHIPEYLTLFHVTSEDFNESGALVEELLTTCLNKVQRAFEGLREVESMSTFDLSYDSFKFLNDLLLSNVDLKEKFLGKLEGIIASCPTRLREELMHGLKVRRLLAVLTVLVHTVEELHAAGEKSIVTSTEKLPAPLKVGVTISSGFAFQEAYEAIVNNLDAFLDPRAVLESRDYIDWGGPMNGLIEFLLKEIGASLVETAPAEIGLQYVRLPLLMDPEVGTFIGAVLAKAVQRKHRPCCKFDFSFYELLGSHDKRLYKEYFDRVYKGELKEMKTRLGLTYAREDYAANTAGLEVVPISKIVLRTPTSMEPTWKPSMDDIGASPCREEMEQYYEDFYTLALDKFYRLVRNMAMSYNQVFQFSLLRYVRDPSLVETMFSQQHLTAEAVWQVVNDETNAATIGSLVEGYSLPLLIYVKTFVQSLREHQLARLLSLWCGSSTQDLGAERRLSLEAPPSMKREWWPGDDVKKICGGEAELPSTAKAFLEATERYERELEPAPLPRQGQGIGNSEIISRPAEFCRIFRSMVRLQVDLLCETHAAAVLDAPVVLSTSGFFHAHASSCFRFIQLPLQNDGMAMFLALVSLLNSSPEAYYDPRDAPVRLDVLSDPLDLLEPLELPDAVDPSQVPEPMSEEDEGEGDRGGAD